MRVDFWSLSHAANQHEIKAGCDVLKATAHPVLEAFSGDTGYRSIIERTFAWLGNFKRLSKNYEILTKSAENRVRIAMIQITLAKHV